MSSREGRQPFEGPYDGEQRRWSREDRRCCMQRARPIHRTKLVHRRTVLHAGFAAVQDDIGVQIENQRKVRRYRLIYRNYPSGIRSGFAYELAEVGILRRVIYDRSCLRNECRREAIAVSIAIWWAEVQFLFAGVQDEVR